MIVLNKIKKPTKIYAEVIEDGALTQFVDTMNQDFVTRGALMADAHQGYTLPIGGVVECENMVMPSYIGFDIGCGVCAILTDFSVKDIRHNAKKIYKQILRNIPVGFNKHSHAVPEWERFIERSISDTMFDIVAVKSGHLQLGTLGGGNHFIEIGVDEERDAVWIIIHSGSRGVGHGCATHYMKMASPTDKASEGHYGFKADSICGMAYIKDMEWCLQFALENRKVMIRLVMDAIRQIGLDGGQVGKMINRNHNHAESTDGRHWIHRKGATHAEEGMYGVIPGNMRDGSFIVVGKGCEDALNSSSHGAGRVLGRRKAKENLDIDEFTLTMEGIVGNVSESTLDESPMAYKNIFDVMALQNDLVEIKCHVKPIINVKG